MSAGQDKQRLDALVVERGLAETRARAQAIVNGGGIRVDGEVITRSGSLVSRDAQLELVHQPLEYVSRGGLKLEHAMRAFNIDPGGRIAIDVGASTGGFTDVLLRLGAARVYAVDVGYGQLAWTLRNDPRVVVMERTNIRKVESLPELASLAVVDVSFISLRLVLPHVVPLLTAGSDIVALIKPQFEAGRELVGKKGVVRSARTWVDVLSAVAGWAIENGLLVTGLERSPIRGPAGNVEFLIHLSLPPGGAPIDVVSAISRVVGEPES